MSVSGRALLSLQSHPKSVNRLHLRLVRNKENKINKNLRIYIREDDNKTMGKIFECSAVYPIATKFAAFRCLSAKPGESLYKIIYHIL